MYQGKVSILRPLGYGPSALPLRHLDNDIFEWIIEPYMLKLGFEPRIQDSKSRVLTTTLFEQKKGLFIYWNNQ